MKNMISEYRYKKGFGSTIYELHHDSVRISGRNDSGNEIDQVVPLGTLRLPGSVLKKKSEGRQFLQAVPSMVLLFATIVLGESIYGYSTTLFWSLVILAAVSVFPSFYFSPKYRIKYYTNSNSGNIEFGVIEKVKNRSSFDKFVNDLEDQIHKCQTSKGVDPHDSQT